MADNPFAGCWAKLKRGEDHILALGAEVDACLKRDPLEIRLEVDPEQRVLVGRMHIAEAPPTSWSLVVGDAVHNLRSALDHAVCRLVEQNDGVVTQRHSFPILDREPSSQQARQRWDDLIRGVSESAEGVIELVQPFNGPEGVRHHPLHSLRELSNEDKHRVVLTRYGSIDSRREISIEVVGAHDVRLDESVAVMADKPLEHEAEVLRTAVSVTGPNPKVELASTMPFEPAFGTVMITASGLGQVRNSIGEILYNLGIAE